MLDLDVIEWIAIYWQPLSGIALGLLPYVYVFYRRGLHMRAVTLTDSYLLMFGGLWIILGFMFLPTLNCSSVVHVEKTSPDAKKFATIEKRTCGETEAVIVALAVEDNKKTVYEVGAGKINAIAIAWKDSSTLQITYGYDLIGPLVESYKGVKVELKLTSPY